MKVFIPYLLEYWYELVEYAKKTLSLAGEFREVSIDEVRRVTEEIGSRSYKSRNSPEVNVKSSSGDDSSDEEENISENGNEEKYLFPTDSE